ncbi:DNA ligase I, ATP-dependent Dnl1 [Halorubrum aidingense JCM 13560]|uniref:DNA ligase n=1 Tax=Halorubrum aidingense JCM 13560 TaxID=1230454 RepID=M0PHZ9_9EURY|nr:ATP-dependent DNA ligase LigA [Halorubrum aidingense]EMA69513.1 DNA ligase I, ATP-dependent Dnl1 [Halorubrum aidingense JCM 13560]
MEFAAFAERAERLAAESADIETTLAVADLLEAAGRPEGDGEAGSTDSDGRDTTSPDGDDLETVTRFLLGRVFPAHDTRTLDIGPALCREAIARAAGPNVSANDVETRLAEAGEIGAVAAGYDFGGQRGLAAFGAGSTGGDGGTGSTGSDGLALVEVDATLRDLAAAEGDGSESRKLDTLFGLFNRCSSAEAKILARLVLGEMRIGVGEGTVRDAVAEAFLADAVADAEDCGDDTIGDEADEEDEGDNEEDAHDDEPILRADDEAVAAVERALQVTNDYGRVAVRARDEGLEGLRAEGLAVGRPVQAMLAQAGTATDAVESFGEVAVETKFDGARVQVHYVPETDGDGDTGLGPRLYSRNMDDVTDALPEIVEYVEARASSPVILDGEVVAVDDAGDPLPFQEVLRRFRRKHDVDRMRDEVTLRLHAFDCLHADGDDLLDEPLRVRHDRLVDVLPDAAASLEVADSPDAIESAEAEALDAGHEGVMLKNPESTYTPGNRGRDWLKRKPDVETLDAVVVGAEWGEGRRAELFGTFLLGVRNEAAGDAFRTIGKVATGLTDEALEALTDRLEPHVVSETGTEITIRPEVVIEVGYEEIQSSPTYSSGYALRFPRFVGVREDKAIADADSLGRVSRLAGDGDGDGDGDGE